LGLEQFWKIGLMNTVAGGAVTGSHRPMEKFSLGNILLGMTGKTKIRSRTKEHELIRRLMRVMALGAGALFYRFMHRFFCVDRIMATITEFCHILDRGKFVLTRFYVTDLAIVYRHGTMHKFILSHFDMAIRRDTGCLRRRLRQYVIVKKMKKNQTTQHNY
jgi:hypothetical protein